MRFYSVIFTLCFGMVCTNSMFSLANKEIIMTCNETEYVFDLRDLEAHIRQKYNCSLDIRADEPEILNAVGPVLVLYEPRLTHNGTLSCKISHEAWNYLRDESRKCFNDTLIKVKLDNWKIGLLTTGSLIPVLAIEALPDQSSKLAALLGVSWLCIAAAALYYAAKEANTWINSKSILWEGGRSPIPLGFIKKYRDQSFVYVETCYQITALPRLNAKA